MGATVAMQKPVNHAMRKQILFLLFFIPYAITFGQVEIKKEQIDYYFTYENFVDDTPNLPEKAYIIIKQENPNSIIYKDILTESANKKIKKSHTIWGIKYKGALYYNLLLANYQIAQDHAFGKFRITGKKLNVVVLDTQKDKKAIGNNGNPYGHGLVAIALYKPNNTILKDKNGNTYKVLFYNAESSFVTMNLEQKVFVKLLSTQDIVDFYNNDPFIIEKLKNGTYYLEDFLAFAEKENE